MRGNQWPEKPEQGARFLKIQKSLVVLFLIAVSIVVGLVFYLNNEKSLLIQDSSEISYLVNISGRQRMLSQNLAKTSLLLAKSDKPDKEFAKELNALLIEFQDSHNELLYENTNLKEPKIDSLYEEINSDYKGLVRSCNSIRRNQSDSLLYLIQYHESRFLPIMDKIVKEYELLGSGLYLSFDKRITQSNYVIGFAVAISASLVLLVTLRIISSFSKKLSQRVSEINSLNERLNTFFQSTSDLIYELDENAKYTYVNETVINHLGLPFDVLKEKTCWEFVPDEYINDVKNHYINHIKKKKKSSYYEFPIIDKENKLVWLGQSVDYKYEKDRAVRAYTIAKDITLAKEASEKNIHTLKEFIYSSPAAIAMFDREVRYIAASEAWYRDYNIEQEIIGLSHYEVFPEIGDEWKRFHQRAIAGEELKKDEDQFERMDGTVQWMKWAIRPWYELSGKVGGLIMLTEDVTEKVLQRKAIIKAKEEQDQLIAIIAHDLKAPFNQIFGFAEILETQLSGEPGKFNEMIKKIASDSTSMIEDLVRLKSYENSEIDLEIEELNLAEFHSQKLQAFGNTAKAKRISIEGGCKVGNVIFQTDKNILNRIVDNLLSNAIKFSPEYSVVRLNIYDNDDGLKISIEDDGPGFSEEDKQLVFKKFQKLSARPTAGESSSGLGLSIVHTLVLRLGAAIDLNSEKGRGAEFIISFPA